MLKDYFLIVCFIYLFYSVFVIHFVETNALTHSHIHAFYLSFSRCKDTLFFQIRTIVVSAMATFFPLSVSLTVVW